MCKREKEYRQVIWQFVSRRDRHTNTNIARTDRRNKSDHMQRIAEHESQPTEEIYKTRDNALIELLLAVNAH